MQLSGQSRRAPTTANTDNTASKRPVKFTSHLTAALLSLLQRVNGLFLIFLQCFVNVKDLDDQMIQFSIGQPKTYPMRFIAVGLRASRIIRPSTRQHVPMVRVEGKLSKQPTLEVLSFLRHRLLKPRTLNKLHKLVPILSMKFLGIFAAVVGSGIRSM